MKVTLDLDKLLEEGKISREEHERIRQLGERSTAALAFNILIGFGVVAVSGATLALVPAPATAIVLGSLVGAGGIALLSAGLGQWRVLANICIVVGALLFGGGVIGLGDGSVGSFLAVAAAFAAAGVLARSQLLTVLAVLALSSCLGARSGYFHATYFLGIEEPALTVTLFTLFSLAAFRLSRQLPLAYRDLALAASRTGVFLVNFGFWIGSLWGDSDGNGGTVVSEGVFSAVWAAALIGAGIWAWRSGRRWLLNIAAIFGAIHLYTQWFETLGASPETLLVAGLLALTFALGLRALNARLKRTGDGAATGGASQFAAED